MRRPAALLLSAVLVAAGCTAEPESPEVSWQPATLPGSQKIIVRDAVSCAGGPWYVVGAFRDANGGTAPAAWTSPDARTWTALRLDAKTYYGKQNVLATAACKDGRLAAVGAKSGGAHANPRTSSWHQTADGVLHEVTAPFELFGGPQAVNVARIDSGPAGFLIAGNRMSGAAVWRSADAAKFEIVERAPALASDAAGETWAFDSVATGGGWLLVGGFLPAGRIDRDPIGWRSADGAAWARVPAVATEAYEEIQRVTVLRGVPVGVGVSGSAFGSWRLEGDRWQPGGSFGVAKPGGATAVRSLTAVGDRLYVVTADGSSYALWLSDDGGVSWRSGSLPATVAAKVETTTAVAGGDGRAVLLTDDGVDGRIYAAETRA